MGQGDAALIEAERAVIINDGAPVAGAERSAPLLVEASRSAAPVSFSAGVARHRRIGLPAISGGAARVITRVRRVGRARIADTGVFIAAADAFGQTLPVAPDVGGHGVGWTQRCWRPDTEAEHLVVAVTAGRQRHANARALATVVVIAAE